MKAKKILVWLSGWVDSAVTAYLLQQAGHEVVGGFMINYFQEDDPNCTTKKDLDVAQEVADHLGIRLFTFDFIEEYERRILRMIYEGYEQWITPNPDVFCNSLVKFDLFLSEAIEYGFDAVATGHYAQIRSDEHGFHLLRGKDPDKDQSYFLSTLSQDQLSKACFPIGELHKSEVREIAKKAKLPNADRKDSQWLCFVWKVDFGAFLKEQITPKKGNILNTQGEIIGEHDGAFQYTIGQRKGIGVGGGPARFVVEKNVNSNTITVGSEDDLELFSDHCTLRNWHWINNATLQAWTYTKLHAKIRYRQELQEVRLDMNNDIPTWAHFLQPQRAITPGQVFALYTDDELVGSGLIV